MEESERDTEKREYSFSTKKGDRVTAESQTEGERDTSVVYKTSLISLCVFLFFIFANDLRLEYIGMSLFCPTRQGISTDDL